MYVSNLLNWFEVLDYGDLATWFGGIITAGTLIVALTQIFREKERRIADEKQKYNDSIKEQASQITCWKHSEDDESYEIIIINNSNVCAYECIVTPVALKGAAPRDAREFGSSIDNNRGFILVVPPGKWSIFTPHPGDAMGVRFGIEIGFTDSSGLHWVRKGNGKLEQIDQPAIEYYEIPQPVDWQTPKERLIDR
ncbi:hypothetical protein [Paenibacillus alkalitolerans]|uniref:hypothetical protein n=1 Tax=Paenibacillus alkalitolerans TaxID=2799335 RepID=UPI0018F742C2|nr:hypothetical protein [Paenibacillus alkalitolerans]